MNLQNKPPIFVPWQYRDEIEKMSKAALMDLVWDYATRCAGSEESLSIITELRISRDIILEHRRQAHENKKFASQARVQS